MNIEVLIRLKNNIIAEKVKHDQITWLRDGVNVFIVTDQNRWTCATTACAAGFIFLQEAPSGSVFDVKNECVFSDPQSYLKYKDAKDKWDRGEGPAVYPSAYDSEGILTWAADVMGVDWDVAEELFYNFGNTDEILDHIDALIERYSA